ncbi:MAG: nucleoside deaminase [Candidatus Omnitrophica bacterium]|nr:nucleoside deaminase [Candidatus Omnitrophota bacterium]
MSGRPDSRYMELAIGEARKNIVSMDGGPFGACIVKGNTVLAVCRNTVLTHDATCHAEVNAIRRASRRLGGFDLSGCTIYSTTEPCPMCFSAIHWARIKKIVFGTTTRDAQKIGFNELLITANALKRSGGSAVEILPRFMIDECRLLFRDWAALPGRKYY